MKVRMKDPIETIGNHHVNAPTEPVIDRESHHHDLDKTTTGTASFLLKKKSGYSEEEDSFNNGLKDLALNKDQGYVSVFLKEGAPALVGFINGAVLEDHTEIGLREEVQVLSHV